LKSTPFSAVRDAYCTRRGVLAGMGFVTGIKGYEELELARRE
jgi:L-rhamnose isomerase